MIPKPADADDHTPTWLRRHPVWTTVLALAAIAAPVSLLLELPGRVFSVVSAVSGTDTEPAITGTWPLARGCDGGTRVAMLRDLNEFSRADDPDEDIRTRMVNDGGGAFESGTLYVHISVPSDGEAIQVFDLRPRKASDQLPNPAWVFDPQSGCGGEDVYRTFEYNLDDGSFEDVGLAGDGTGKAPGTLEAELGPSFTITPGHFALVQVAAVACDANYQWNMVVEYQVAGDEEMHKKTLGPYISYGQHGSAEAITGHLDGGGLHPTESTGDFTRPNGTCTE